MGGQIGGALDEGGAGLQRDGLLHGTSGPHLAPPEVVEAGSAVVVDPPAVARPEPLGMVFEAQGDESIAAGLVEEAGAPHIVGLLCRDLALVQSAILIDP